MQWILSKANVVNVAYVAHITQLAACVLHNADMLYGKTIVIANFQRIGS